MARKVAKKATRKPAKKAAKKAARKKAAKPEAMPKPAHGTFMWYELMTREDEAAMTFFEKLLGWTHEDWPLGAGKAPYRIMKTPQKSVAGIMKMTEPEFPAAVPTHWCGYIAVRDVDASWKLIGELGGEQIHPPTDIPEIGRFCIFKDPTGAVLALMTPVQGVV